MRQVWKLGDTVIVRVQPRYHVDLSKMLTKVRYCTLDTQAKVDSANRKERWFLEKYSKHPMLSHLA